MAVADLPAGQKSNILASMTEGFQSPNGGSLIILSIF
jgi:hypothetical protein